MEANKPTETKFVSQLNLAVDDHAIETLVTNAVACVGDGFIDVQAGGQGTPYQLEVVEKPRGKSLSTTLAREEINALKIKIREATDEATVKACIASLNDFKQGRAVIWINAGSQEEYLVHANVVDYFIKKAQTRLHQAHLQQSSPHSGFWLTLLFLGTMGALIALWWWAFFA